MVSDKLFQTAMMELVGDRLERYDILQHLIEPTADTLAILRDEARNATGRDDSNHQYDAIQNTSDKIHDYLMKL
jgi:hypothetical protein